MKKIIKPLLITLVVFLLPLTFLFTGCFANNSMAKAIQTLKSEIPELKSEIPENSFQKIAEYLETNGQQRNDEFFIEKHQFSFNSTTQYAYYQEIAYSTTTGSLYLKGITNKSATTVTLEIPNLTDYSNHTFTYNAEYKTKNNQNKDVTLKATFSVPSKTYTSSIDTQKLPTLNYDNRFTATSIGNAKLTNFRNTIPNAIQEAEAQLKEIFTKVTNLSTENNQYAYKIYFCLPTFENPLAMPTV